MTIELRNLLNDDLHAVSLVHITSFPDSALTKLGVEAVRRYYEWQIIGPHDAIAIAAFDNDKLVGYCFSGVFRGALGGYLKKNRRFLISRVITHPWLLLNPLVRERAQFALQRLFGKLTSKPDMPVYSQDKSESMAAPSFGILSIGVISEYRGMGTAYLLMKHAESIAIERGFVRMSLTVHPSNQRAVRFYEKLGWQRELTAGVWAGRMSKVIDRSINCSE